MLSALRIPAICFVVGILGIAAFGVITAEPLLPLYFLAQYVVTLPIGLGIFYLCCLLWIGFDAPLVLNAAALLGTYAIADLVGVVVEPLSYFGWVIWIVTYISVLSQLLDIELVDAIYVALITGFAKFVLALILVALYYGAI